MVTRVTTDGTFHDVDSCERGCEIAGREAGRAALIGAGLLSPDQASTLRWVSWPGQSRPRRRPPQRSSLVRGGG
ncbi:hypothetical protein [Streptomyces syringium]|uniref:hypothetical protein n=1 Tax=Streptomyces syringium TaxID=76729 RepID=UPI0033AB0E52